MSDSVRAAKEADQRIQNEDGLHQAIVCVVCNEIIKAVEPFCWIDEEFLQSNDVKDRVGVEHYEQHYRLELKDELVNQYTLPGLESMFLLP